LLFRNFNPQKRALLVDFSQTGLLLFIQQRPRAGRIGDIDFPADKAASSVSFNVVR